MGIADLKDIKPSPVSILRPGRALSKHLVFAAGPSNEPAALPDYGSSIKTALETVMYRLPVESIAT
jgi:hypothetical protein